MSRVWIFRETGEVREPKIDEWYLWGDEVCLLEKEDCYCGGKTSILTLEALDYDPMESIREVYEKYHGSYMPKWRQTEKENDLWDAVKKVVEGK